ncbi:MAG: hypothetical protein K2G67_04330 [Muribaculaceae bacterium]|nr:hypothetical protein [Muribaculaceae bacterium]
MGFAEAYKRWRHTRGYGVHSPFAYRIVRRVVRQSPGYRYYIESDLPEMSRAERREVRQLIRLAAELDIRSAAIAPQLPESYAKALHEVRSDMSTDVLTGHPSGHQLIIGYADLWPTEVCTRILNSPSLKALWIKNPPAGHAPALFNALSEGVLFIGKNAILVIPHPGMQKVAYSVCI